jgi:tRNA threonylcarbamoyladenosine biosynthesis protein TsaB
MDRGHQEWIAPLVQEVVAEAGITLQRLRRIGVTTGPGSFTGLRVGLAFARTLAMTLGCESVGLSSLEALAASAPTGGTTLSAIPSRQDLLFVAFHVGGEPVTAPDQLGPAEIAARLAEIWTGGDLTLVGPGARALAHLAPSATVLDISHPSPAALARRVASAPIGAAPPRALYLRAPDARTLAERGARA